MTTETRHTNKGGTTPQSKADARQGEIERIEADVRRWNGYVETLLRAFQSAEGPPPTLGARVEGLRHKRDTVLTKVEALKRHRERGWRAAHRELGEARRELRDAWRLVISTLQKESLFI